MSTEKRLPGSGKKSSDTPENNILDELLWMEQNGGLRPDPEDQEPDDDLDPEAMTDEEINANWNFGTRAEHEGK